MRKHQYTKWIKSVGEKNEAQLYLYEPLRKDLQKSIELFNDVYANKMASVFKNIEEEMEAKAEERYDELGENYNTMKCPHWQQ